MPPSGYGSRPRVFQFEAPANSLSVTSSTRFCGAIAGIVMTSSAVPTDAVVKVNGVTQAVSTRDSSTQITFTMDAATTRTKGVKSVTWFSPGSGQSSLGANFTVTEILAAEYSNISLADITLGAGSGGTQVVSQTDLSGNGYTRTTGAGTGVVYVANASGSLGGITAPNTASTLRSVALCTALQNRIGISMVRAIKSSNAAQAGRGCYGITLNDAAGNQFFLGGYSGLGTMPLSKWTIGAASTARRGTTLFDWSAGEVWVESMSTYNNGTAVLRKNNDPAVTFDLNNNGTAALGPNSVTIGAGNYADMLFSADTGTQHYLYEMYADSALSDAVIGEMARYIGGLTSVSVAASP